MALEYQCCPTTLDQNRIDEFLIRMRDLKNPSKSYFKHAVFGLKYAFDIAGKEHHHIKLPKINKAQPLPVVLSKPECRKLFQTPEHLRDRILLCLIYSAGLRACEAAKLLQADIDFDRRQIHIRKSKYNKDRYVPLAVNMAYGLRKYFNTCKPHKWVFNGRDKLKGMSVKAISTVMRKALQKARITKKACTHTLRHSYATHLLEDGLDIHTIQKLLGHQWINTTLVYLHVAQTTVVKAHSPFDTLYPKKP